jgi:hypothetical protein
MGNADDMAELNQKPRKDLILVQRQGRRHFGQDLINQRFD